MVLGVMLYVMLTNYCPKVNDADFLFILAFLLKSFSQFQYTYCRVSNQEDCPPNSKRKSCDLTNMPYISSPEDGASLFYIDYRPSPQLAFRPDHESISRNEDTTLVFDHGWPMSGRMYEHLMLPLSQTYGIRCIASDRRGFGKSEWSGAQEIEVTYETFARDTLAIITSIKDLRPFTFVCSSMGCGESLLVYEMMREKGLEGLCRGFIWMGPTMPHPVQTDSNPLAPSQQVWDMILDGFRIDRTGFVRASIAGVFGVPHGIEMSETAQEFFMALVSQADAIAIERCCRILSKYDFTDKLKAFGKAKPADVKVLILHGDKDQSKLRVESQKATQKFTDTNIAMPIEASAGLLQKYIPGCRVKLYQGAAHGLYYTSAGEVLKDILAEVGETS